MIGGVTGAPTPSAARKLCAEDFAFGALLGEGSYARVRLCAAPKRQRRCALD